MNLRRASLLLWLAAVALLATPMSFAAETPLEQFNAANRLYEQGKFGEAARIYESLAATRQVSPELLFNLGSARLKNGELGPAIAAFLSAERLAPRDPDIQKNLQFARTSAGVPFSPVALWRRVFRMLAVNEWAVLASVAVWTLLILLALPQFLPALKRRLALWTPLAAALAVMLVVSLAVAGLDQLGTRAAVIGVKEAKIRFGPLEESKSAFSLMDGAEVTVLDSNKEWLQIRDLAGQTGWVKREQVALVE